MAFVVILHLSPEYESQLDKILQSETKMPVIQVHETLTVEPNHVYVIPPSKHLALVDGLIRLIEPEKTRGKRVPIDIFFRTLAEAYGKNGIAIVLSGTGSDGTLGLKRVKEAGGICIAQDPQQAEYSDMPNNAINTKLVDLVLPVGEMPQKLLNIKQGIERLAPNADLSEVAKGKATGLRTDALHDVLSLLKAQTGHDFTDYKRPTMLRRVTRRLQVHGFDDIPPYVNFLKNNPEEVQRLLRDLLISVTNFFRDKEAFEALEEQVIPELFRNKGEQDQVRVWCVACATGEEAYSVAMLLLEHASKLVNPPRIQIFATDIEEASLATARAGRYDETINLDVSPQRLRRFFIKEDHYYVVKEEIREMVLFAPHNILRDPPFSRQDLVVCRNLLIYLNRATQEKIFQIYHFALRPNGFLFVGASESAESVPSLFSSIDKKQHIYQVRPAVVKYSGMSPIPFISQRFGKTVQPETKSEISSSFADLHCKIIERFAAPSVLIDENYDILHSGKNATSFLQFPSGEPTRNLIKTVLPALKQDLLAALFTAREEHKPAEARNIRIQADDNERFINLCVQPIEFPEVAEGFFLVTFDKIKKENIPDEILKTVLRDSDDVSTTVITRLEEELHLTKNRLRLTIEEQETTVEELKASNEELQAMNEKLRSATEELETGREELQSINEEMITVNHELKEKVDEISRANSDLRNLITSTNIGTIFLDRALNIQLYTPPVQQLFNIIASDLGRPLEHITHKLDYEKIIDDANEVLRSLHSIQREVQSHDNHWYLAQLTPYRTMDDHIDGVVITFMDFTERKQGEVELARITAESQQQTRFFHTILSNIFDYTYAFDKNGRFLYSNKSHSDLLQLLPQEIVGKNFFDLEFPPQLADKLHKQIQQVFETKMRIKDETSFTRPDGHRGCYEYIFSPVIGEDGEVELIAGSSRDITEHQQNEKALQEADRRKDIFMATLAHELRNPLAPIRSGLELIRRSQNDPQIIERTLSIIERQTNRIVHLVDDLLEIARITQGKINLRKERFRLKIAIDAAVESCQDEINANKHQLTISLPDNPVYINADLVRIEQVLLNLLTNAAKYTPPGGHIWLSASKVNDEAVISVRDNGLGLPPDRIASIFEMFNQVEKTVQNDCNGLGIGLGVVKQLVEMHGGSVSAASEGEGKGSEFIVRLPLAAPTEITSQPDKEAKMTEGLESPKKKILIIDDNIDVSEMVKALLSMEGHDVRVAHDGESGIETAKEYQPDVCLCDIGLPDIDGYELGRQLRVLLPDTKLIAFSGWGQDSDRQRSKEAGFDEHVVKASNIDQLIKLIA